MYSSELKRGFGLKFWIAVIAGCIIAVMDFILSCGPMVRNILNMVNETEFGLSLMEKTNYSISTMECFMGIRMSSLSYVYFFILPILCALPYADTYSTDRNGYINAYMGRVSSGKYGRSKMLCSFLSAGCAAVIPLFLNLILCLCFFPFTKPVSLIGRYSVMSNSFLEKVFYEFPAVYLLIYLSFIFLFFGLLNCVSIIAVRVEANSLVAFLTPFALYYLVHTVLIWAFNKAYASPIRYSYLPTFYTEALPDVCIQFMILVLMAVLGYLIMRKKDA